MNYYSKPEAQIAAQAARLRLLADLLDLGDSENAWAAIAAGMLEAPELEPLPDEELPL